MSTNNDDDELLETIWEHKKRKKISWFDTSNVKPMCIGEFGIVVKPLTSRVQQRWFGIFKTWGAWDIQFWVVFVIRNYEEGFWKEKLVG